MNFHCTKLIIDYWLCGDHDVKVFCEVEFGKKIPMDFFYEEVEQSAFETKYEICIDCGGGTTTEEWSIADIVFENEDAYEDPVIEERDAGVVILNVANEVTELLKAKGYPATLSPLQKRWY